MIAIWLLLGLAVLFGGAILAFVVYAVRHDDSADGATAGTEAGRFRPVRGVRLSAEAADLRVGRDSEVDR